MKIKLKKVEEEKKPAIKSIVDSFVNLIKIKHT